MSMTQEKLIEVVLETLGIEKTKENFKKGELGYIKGSKVFDENQPSHKFDLYVAWFILKEFNEELTKAEEEAIAEKFVETYNKKLKE